MHQCKLIADVGLFYKDEILLVKYSDTNKYDHQNGWFLPDDGLMEFEDPHYAAKRILSEQLGLNDAEITFSHFESFKGNDKSWHLVFHFKSVLNEKPVINKSGDIDDYSWFKLSNLPDKKEVAHHGWALYTIQSLKKVEQ